MNRICIPEYEYKERIEKAAKLAKTGQNPEKYLVFA